MAPKLRRELKEFTPESVAHRPRRRNPQPMNEGADSFRRLLGCEQHPAQECDSPAHCSCNSPPLRERLILEPTCREQLRSAPAAIASESCRSIRDTWLAMLLHLSFVHDGKGSCYDTCESQDACKKGLVVQSVGGPQPNEMRLSCGAN